MNIIQIKHLARKGVPQDESLVAPHTSVQLTVFIDGHEFGTTDSALTTGPVVDAHALLGTREFAVGAYILSCGCGIPECAGIDEPIQVRRGGGVVRWTLPDSYADYRQAWAIDARTYEFDARQYDETLQRAVAFVEHAETMFGLPALIGEPVYFYGDDFATQMGRVATRLKTEQPKRLKVQSGRFVAKYELVAPISRRGYSPDYEGALPQLGAEEHGTRMAVGSIRQHIVYKFHYDERSKAGHWAFLYFEQDGRLADTAAAD